MPADNNADSVNLDRSWGEGQEGMHQCFVLVVLSFKPTEMLITTFGLRINFLYASLARDSGEGFLPFSAHGAGHYAGG